VSVGAAGRGRSGGGRPQKGVAPRGELDSAPALALRDEGLQGFGGQLRRSCAGVAPGGTCQAGFPSASALASASQPFPPYGEVAAPLRMT